MTPLCDHPVIHSALTNKHAAWKESRAGLWETQISWILTSEAVAQPARFPSVEETRTKTGNTEWDM